jgi:arylsulfatase
MVGDCGTPAYQGYIREDCWTIAEVLKQAGYRTAMSGKWHAGGNWPRDPQRFREWTFHDPKRPLPNDRGFDEFYGHPAGAGSYYNPTPLIEGHRVIESPDDCYTTDLWTDAALGMIDRAVDAESPFFLHVSYNAPHWPLHAPEEDIARYRGKYDRGWDYFRTARHEEQKGMGLLDKRWEISPRDDWCLPWEDRPYHDWQALRMAVYAAQVDRMDQNIGRLVEKLKARGVYDNTLIVFLSDNGGCAEFLREDGVRPRENRFTREGEPIRFGNHPQIDPGGPLTYQSYGQPWANVSNAPFRRFKSWVHEGGISTPFVAHWPQGIKAGAIRHEACHLVDLVATFVDLAGATVPEERNGQPATRPEGESLVSLLDGGTWQRQAPIYWEHVGNRAVRNGEWKLVSEKRYDEWELYNITDDRTELNNLANAKPDTVKELAALWEDWAQRCGVLSPEELQKVARERR